jgi:Phage integrase family
MRAQVFRRSGFDPAAAMIGRPGLHPHELRHTAASLAIAAGADVKVIQRILGHASAAMTLDQYGHLFGDRLDDVAARMAAGREAAVVKLCPSGSGGDSSTSAQAPEGPQLRAFRVVPPAGFEPALPPPEGEEGVIED